MERLKVYNANLQAQGLVDRDIVHREGLWHKTFHCWVVSNVNGGSLLCQLRAKEKMSYPNMLDISAAGHLAENEEDMDGIREISEELGIDILYEKLYPLGYRVEVDDADNGMKNREYQSVYLAIIDKSLQLFNPQVDEVSGLLWIKISDALLLFSDKMSSIDAHGVAFNKDISKWEEVRRSVSVSDFIPRIQQYYLTISIMAERLLCNNFPLAIS